MVKIYPRQLHSLLNHSSLTSDTPAIAPAAKVTENGTDSFEAAISNLNPTLQIQKFKSSKSSNS